MTAETVIRVSDAGIRFRRNRRGRRSFKDLFAGSQRRSRPDEFWALRNVSVDVLAGEAIGVVGRNGQGKSTLLKLVAGVMLPDEGVVDVHGGVAPLIEITGGFVDDLTVVEVDGSRAEIVALAAAIEGELGEVNKLNEQVAAAAAKVRLPPSCASTRWPRCVGQLRSLSTPSVPRSSSVGRPAPVCVRRSA